VDAGNKQSAATDDKGSEILQIITLTVGAGAFFFGLYQWMRGQAWKRAAKGRKLVDNLLDSNDSNEEYYAWDAMKMLDYQDETKPFRTKRICGSRHVITRKKIEDALGKSESDSDELVYVRECFDELYFKFGQLQDAIDNKLVELKHVSCPADYYVGLLAETDVKLHNDYLNKYMYQRTRQFLKNFPVWDKAVAELAEVQRRKYSEQAGMCGLCGKPLSEDGSVLDRLDAKGGYTDDNTRILCLACDRKIRAESLSSG
jgi:hypothetical protein